MYVMRWLLIFGRSQTNEEFQVKNPHHCQNREEPVSWKNQQFKASYRSLCDEERKSQKLTGNIDLHIIQNTKLLKYKKQPKKLHNTKP